MPTNSDNVYPYPQIKKNQLISYRNWLTKRLQKLKTTITFQTDYKENQSEIQKQSNLLWFQKNLTPSVKQEIQDLHRQIDAHLDQISDGPIRDILKTTLYLPQIKEKPEESLSSHEEKQDLCKAIFDYLIQFDLQKTTEENTQSILSDKKTEALNLLLEIIDKSTKDNRHSLIATWFKEDQIKESWIDKKKKSWISYFDSKKKNSWLSCFGYMDTNKNNRFEAPFLNDIARALGMTKQGELAKLAKPCDSKEYDRISNEVKQALKPSRN